VLVFRIYHAQASVMTCLRYIVFNNLLQITGIANSANSSKIYNYAYTHYTSTSIQCN